MSEVPLLKIFEVLPEEGPSGLSFHTSPQQKFTSQSKESTNCDIDNDNCSLDDLEEDSLNISETSGERETSGIYFSPSARKQDSNRKSSLYFADESQSSDSSLCPVNTEKKILNRGNEDSFHRSPYLLRSSLSRSSSMDNLNNIDNYSDIEVNQNCQGNCSRRPRRKTMTVEECRSCFPKKIPTMEITAKEKSFAEKKKISIKNSLPPVIEDEEESEISARRSLSSNVTTDSISFNINSKQNTSVISHDALASVTDSASVPLTINVQIPKEFNTMPVNLIITKQPVMEFNECEKSKTFDDKTKGNNTNEEVMKLNESNDAIIKPIEEFDISKPGTSSTPNTSLVSAGTDKNNEKKGPGRKRKNNKAESKAKTNNKAKSKKTAKNKENKCRTNDNERRKLATNGKKPAKASKQAKCNKKSRIVTNKKISHRPCRHCESSSESDSSCCSICDGFVCTSSTSSSSCGSSDCSRCYSSDYSSFCESD